MMKTVLLMLSGGVDSSYLLYRYLRDTEHRVHAHHISIRYPHQHRWMAEDPACEAVVDWCRDNVRSFEYSTSRFDLDFHRIGWDSDLQLLVASKVALNLGSEPIELVLGWCADDLERPRVRERQERGVTPRLWNALRESTGRPNLDEEIRMPLVEEGLSKADIVAAMPAELFGRTWSCRQPVFDVDAAGGATVGPSDGPAEYPPDIRGNPVSVTPRPCGECHACRLRQEASG